jgi:hypothetical protein
MTEPENKTPTAEETRDYYANLVALIINGDAEKKAKLDVCATKLLTVARTTYPTLADKTLAGFMSSTAYLVAQTMTLQARDLSDFLEHTFNDYMTVAAVLVGAYNLESTDVPPVPEVKIAAPEPEPEEFVPGTYL